MSGRGRIVGLLAYPLAAAVIAAGLMIPKILIEGREGSLLGGTRIVRIQDRQPLSYREQTPPAELSQAELITRLSAWEDNGGTISLREPSAGELSMDAAFSAAVGEMQELMDRGVLPALTLGRFQLNTAELYGNSVSGAARWELKVSCGEEQAALYLDAETGKIYWLDLSCPQSDSLSDEERAALFARYHGIRPEDAVFDEKGGILTMGGLAIQVEGTDPTDSRSRIFLAVGAAP